MKLTPEQLRQTADAIEAHKAGNLAEMQQADGEWVTAPPSLDDWNFNLNLGFRPKPEPKVRPWSKPEDVPLGVVYMRSAGFSGGFSILLSAGSVGIQIPTYTHENSVIAWSDIADMEYSTDRKEWKPCLIQE